MITLVNHFNKENNKMGIYVQESESSLILTFSGPWAKPFTTVVNILRDNKLVVLELPTTLFPSTTVAPISCQLPGDLVPRLQTQTQWIGSVNDGTTARDAEFVLDANALLRIFGALNFTGFPVSASPVGFYGAQLIWVTK